jgi:hypothetical protein
MHVQVMSVCTAKPLNYLQVNKSTYGGSSSSSNKQGTTYRVSDVGMKFLRESSAQLPGNFKPPLDFINAVQLCRARVAAAASCGSGSSSSSSASAAMVNINSMFQTAISKGAWFLLVQLCELTTANSFLSNCFTVAVRACV